MFYTITSIAPICYDLHTTNRKLVLATGFFDLLHSEHINFLQKAKAVGDILIVAVESDTRARALKGEGRPIESQQVRCQKLLDLRFTDSRINGFTGNNNIVDYVIQLDDDFNNFEAYDSLMKSIKPEIYAVSSHTNHQPNKSFLTEKYGGKLVIVHDFNPDISTSKIIKSQNQL